MEFLILVAVLLTSRYSVWFSFQIYLVIFNSLLFPAERYIQAFMPLNIVRIFMTWPDNFNICHLYVSVSDVCCFCLFIRSALVLQVLGILGCMLLIVFKNYLSGFIKGYVKMPLSREL